MLARAELLARFITRSEWVRADGTLRQDAFIPPSDLNLSVTRHADLDEHGLWARGREVAAQLSNPLRGRADIAVQRVRDAGLDAVAAPLEGNPQHAHMVGWPGEKSARKALAQRLAADAVYVAIPRSETPHFGL